MQQTIDTHVDQGQFTPRLGRLHENNNLIEPIIHAVPKNSQRPIKQRQQGSSYKSMTT
jgi:hypothetical protein